MIAAWMIYTIAVAAFAAAAAHIAERTARMMARPGRSVWAAATLLACLAPLATKAREAPDAGWSAASPDRDIFDSVVGRGMIDESHTTLLPSIPATIRVPSAPALATLDRPLRTLWITGSAAWLLVLVTSACVLRRRVARWTPAVVDGVPVLVSHSVGPALVGLFAPVIVVPAWTLELPHEQRLLVVEHERQHAHARDPLLLLAGALALATMPWNIALWYAWHRLRLAIEADCDQRVLRAHPAVHVYGSLLLEVSGRSLVGAAPLMALAEPASHLARRIELMTTRRSRPTSRQLVTATIASAVCAALACGTPQPTASPTPSESATATRHELEQLLASMPNATTDSLSILLGELRSAQARDTIADSTLRRAVAEHYPELLRSGIRPRPLIWFVADGRDSILASATGHDGLTRTATGSEVLEWESGVRKFPGVVPPSMAPDGLLEWRLLASGRDTVDVIWIRVTGETNGR